MKITTFLKRLAVVVWVIFLRLTVAICIIEDCGVIICQSAQHLM